MHAYQTRKWDGHDKLLQFSIFMKAQPKQVLQATKDLNCVDSLRTVHLFEVLEEGFRAERKSQVLEILHERQINWFMFGLLLQ